MSDAQRALLILGIVVGGSLLLALQTRRAQSTADQKPTGSLTSWSIGDRRFGTWLVFVLMAGEIYTTFTLLGASGWIYAWGAPAFYILAAGTIAYVSSYWLLPAIWRRATAWQVLTQPEFFARAFESPTIGRVVAAASLLALFPYLILQLTGLGLIVSETSFGALTPRPAILLGLLVMTGYVVMSGVRGSAQVAALKDALVLTTVLVLAVILPHHLFGGLTPMFDRLISERPELLTFPTRGYSGTWYASSVVLTALGFFLWPHTFASVFTARDAHTFRRNAVLMPLYQLMLVAVFIIGYAAVLAVPGLDSTDTDLALVRVVRQAMPAWLVGIVGAAGALTALVPGSLILITMATIGARLTLGTDDPRAVRRARWLVPAIALLALLGAWYGSQSLVSLLLLAYAVVAQLFPALVCALRAPGRISGSAVIAGLVTGEAVVAIDLASGRDLLATYQPQLGAFVDLNVGLVALAANVIVLLTVSLAQRARH